MQLQLVCPVDRCALTRREDLLLCEQGHEYHVVEGIPILLRSDVSLTHGAAARSLEAARRGSLVQHWVRQGVATNGVDPLVQEIIGATNGNLYRHAIGALADYPIPEFRLPEGQGKWLLDIGCNWGRWSIAAARKGYRVIGIDPDLEALVAASRVATSMGLEISFICGDARYLPFADSSIDRVFSYSVIQHFSKDDARRTLNEVARILAPNGESFIQMPNALGIRSIYHQVRRGFRIRGVFDVRYWTPGELSRTFSRIVGPTTMTVDGFFGLGVQASDVKILPRRYRAVVHASELARRVTSLIPPIKFFADSLYLSSRRVAKAKSAPIRNTSL